MRITSNTGRTSKRRASFCDTPPERARRGAALVYMRNPQAFLTEIARRLFGFDRGVIKEKLMYGNIIRLQQQEVLVRDGEFWFVPPRWEGGVSLHDDRAVVRKICRVVGCVICSETPRNTRDLGRRTRYTCFDGFGGYIISKKHVYFVRKTGS